MGVCCVFFLGGFFSVPIDVFVFYWVIINFVGSQNLLVSCWPFRFGLTLLTNRRRFLDTFFAICCLLRPSGHGSPRLCSSHKRAWCTRSLRMLLRPGSALEKLKNAAILINHIKAFSTDATVLVQSPSCPAIEPVSFPQMPDRRNVLDMRPHCGNKYSFNWVVARTWGALGVDGARRVSASSSPSLLHG
jgi:hypothetical protein